MSSADARALLEDAEVVHVAIETGRGPHVTPELFCWNGGRLWFATARRTLKARKTKTGARAGVFLEHGTRGLMLLTEARPLDPVRPDLLLGARQEVPLVPTAAAAFVLRNAGHLAGFVAQGPWAWPHSLGTLRMFVALKPLAAALLSHDEIESFAGEWAPDAPRGRAGRRPAAVEADDLPDDLEPLAEGWASDAVVALSSPSGPVALPATWDGRRSEASVRRELLTLAGVDDAGPGAVEVDRMSGYAMEGKRGMVVRGDTHLAHRRDHTIVAFDPERATYWRGMETETVPASSS